MNILFILVGCSDAFCVIVVAHRLPASVKEGKFEIKFVTSPKCLRKTIR